MVGLIDKSWQSVQSEQIDQDNQIGKTKKTGKIVEHRGNTFCSTLPNYFLQSTRKEQQEMNFWTALIIVWIVATVSSAFTDPKTDWYKNLKNNKAPPSSVFPIVWTTLYIGYAYAWSNNTTLDSVFAVGLLLNALWSLFFFKYKQIQLAFIDLLMLFGVISYLTYRMYNVDTVKYFALLAYSVWLVYAGYLNYNLILENTETDP